MPGAYEILGFLFASKAAYKYSINFTAVKLVGLYNGIISAVAVLTPVLPFLSVCAA